VNLFNNRVIIRRQDGTVIKEIAASVQKRIYLEEKTVEVEVGDFVSQLLPSGLEKKLLVTSVMVYDTGSRLDHIEIEYTAV
jgi:hypothetical protein